MRDTLPNNWIETNLSNAVIYGKGKKPKNLSTTNGKDMVPYINIKAFERGIIDEFADIPSSKVIDSEDILVVWDGARFGLTGMGMAGAAGSTLMVLKPVLCYPKYIYSFINRYYSYINSKPKGTGTPHVNPDIFWNLQFPIAPLNEQKRIVAKLDAISSRIDSLKTRLDKIPALIKCFRQSVLTDAVTGKLTETWREKHPEVESAEVLLERMVKGNENIKWQKNEEYAFQWVLVPAKYLCAHITKGTTPKNQEFTNSGIPYLKVYNIVNNKIDFEYKPQYVSNDIHRNFFKRSIVYPGDLLMNIVGPPLGKVAIVPHYFPEWNINQALAIFRPLEILSNQYLFLVLTEGFCLQKIFVETRGVVGQSNLSLEQCRHLLIPLPPIEEQKEIVRQVENLFTLADKLEVHYQKAKARIDKLSQSVLAKAFRGELTPQDPNDEPAEKLLERIMAEKAKMESALKGNKKKGGGRKAKAGSRK